LRRYMQAGALFAFPYSGQPLQEARDRYLIGGAPTVVTGPLGPSLMFGGADWLDIGDFPRYSFGSGAADTPFSVTAWVNMTDATSFCIMGKGVYNTDAEWRLLVAADDLLYFQQFDESVADCYIGQGSTATLTEWEGRWVNICATYDGSETSAGTILYVNGVAVASTAAENNPGTYVAMEDLAHAVWLGLDATDYAEGAITAATIWGRVLSPAEAAGFASGGGPF